MQQLVTYWYSTVPQHVSDVFTPIIRRSDCVTLPIVFCPIVAVVMLESRVASCVHLLIKDARSFEHKGKLKFNRSNKGYEST